MGVDDFFEPDLYENKVGPGRRVSEFYGRCAGERVGKILELGCGTGDILIPLARLGYNVAGVDSSTSMLDVLRAKLSKEPEETASRVKVFEQDAVHLSLPLTFGQVLATNEFISLILEDHSLLQMLKSCFNLLEAGGRMVLDVPKFDINYLQRYSDANRHYLRDRGLFATNDESLVHVWERTAYDKTTRKLEALFRYEHIDKFGTITRSWIRRLNLKPRTDLEIELLLRAAGFAMVDMERMEPSEDGSPLVFYATK